MKSVATLPVTGTISSRYGVSSKIRVSTHTGLDIAATTGTTVLLIEQNANKALSIADRGYVLETGKVVLSGTGEELLASDEVRKAYLGG